MCIKIGNAKHAFDLQSYNFKESIQELKILGVIKACSVCAIHEFLRPERPLGPTQKRSKTQEYLHQFHTSCAGQTIFLS